MRTLIDQLDTALLRRYQLAADWLYTLFGWSPYQAGAYCAVGFSIAFMGERMEVYQSGFHPSFTFDIIILICSWLFFCDGMRMHAAWTQGRAQHPLVGLYACRIFYMLCSSISPILWVVELYQRNYLELFFNITGDILLVSTPYFLSCLPPTKKDFSWGEKLAAELG